MIVFLKQVEVGVAVKELGGKAGFSDATFYKWWARTGISERRGCRLMGLLRTVLRDCPRGDRDSGELRGGIVDLGAERRRFGYRRIHALLRWEGTVANHKRVQRIDQHERLQV